MEAFLQERSESLVSALRFGLKEQASLITDRREATFFPSGPSENIGPGQSRVIKFVLAADAWLQSQTVTFTCQVENNAADELRFLGSLPMCLFRTVRLYISGIPAEISEEYNRVHQMFELCLSKDHYVLEHTKVQPLEDPYASKASKLNTAALGEQDTCRLMSKIPGNGGGTKMNAVTVTGSFNLGTLQSAMLIPLSHSPLTLELELVGTAAEVVQSPIVGGGGGADAGGVAGVPDEPRSAAWSIRNPRINCSLMTLSSSANAEYDKLLSTSGILINAKSYTTMQQSLGTASSSRMNFFLSKSNIEALFLTFVGTPQVVPETFQEITGAAADPGARQVRATAIEQRLQATYKEVNTFMHPDFFVSDGNGTAAHKASKVPFTVRLSIGSKLLPEHAIESPQEAMYHLLQALGLTAMRDSIACAGHGYSRLAHIQAYNTERYTGAGEDYDGLGLSTRGAEGIQVQLTGNVGGRGQAAIYQGTAAAAANGCLEKCFLTIVSSLKLLLKTGVCQVSD